ncbi:MAG TPA: GntR family transcriptional regulator [Eubacterium sp.]|nr:GntR family transcriptional regulator [Lachnospiraceae bacterium]HAZ91767.1 GntR family transcriptional regulator [Eubacterium sp.]HBZ53267.1 GntR family transcriptional regulator [Eubacterium sp.]
MFIIDQMSRVPVYTQIVEQVKRFIMTGIFKAGDQMPSVRSMSARLSINPNTIQKAYTELDMLGLIRSVPGKGCYITEDAVLKLKESKVKELDRLEEVIRDLILAGISKESILECVERSFGNDRD